MDDQNAPNGAPEQQAPSALEAVRSRSRGPLAWLEAIALGIGDTAKDMLEAGRQGAREAHDEMWARFDQKTRYRRRTGDDETGSSQD